MDPPAPGSMRVRSWMATLFSIRGGRISVWLSGGSAGSAVPCFRSLTAPSALPCRTFPPDRPSTRRLDVVAQEHVLVAQVKLPVGDHRVGPGRELRPVRRLEAAGFDILFGIRLDEEDRALPAFVAGIEPSLLVADRSLPGLAGLPLHGPRLELQARQLSLVRPVKMTVHQDHAAVMVLHFLCEIDFFHAEKLAVLAELREAAAVDVGGRGENVVLRVDRSGAVCRLVRGLRETPEELAVGRRDAD